MQTVRNVLFALLLILAGYRDFGCGSPYSGCTTNQVSYGSILQVVAGTDYYLSVSTISGPGMGTVNMTCIPQTYDAPNDECTGATTITDGQTPFDLSRATNPQTSTFSQPYRDLWFSYTAPCTGASLTLPDLSLISTGSLTIKATYEANIIVHKGTCAAPTQIFSVNYGSTGNGAVVTGTTYFLRAGATSPLSVFTGMPPQHFNLSCTGAPANDKPRDGIPFPGSVGVPFNYTTNGATADRCTSDIFYNWTATCTGLARLTGCGVYNASAPQTLRLEAPSSPLLSHVPLSQLCSLYRSFELFLHGEQLQPGRPFFQQLRQLLASPPGTTLRDCCWNFLSAASERPLHFSPFQPGSAAFVLYCDPQTYDLPNDECAGAISITDGARTYDGTKATNDQSTSNYYFPYRDQWFAYQATCTGSIIVTVPATSVNSRVDIMTSCTASSSTNVRAGNSGSLTGATQGTLYIIRAGYQSSYLTNASSSFTVSCVGAPPNDKQAGAVRITGEGTFNFDTTGSATESCSNDVWFVWTATCSGLARATSCGLPITSSMTTYLTLQTSTGPCPCFSSP